MLLLFLFLICIYQFCKYSLRQTRNNIKNKTGKPENKQGFG